MAGVKYHFTVDMVETSCMNNADNNGNGLADCPQSNGGMVSRALYSVGETWPLRSSKHKWGARCSSVVRAFALGAMGCPIDP